MIFRQAGFTLIELLITISIIGILSGIVYTNFSGAGGAGRDAKRASDLRALESAIDQYKNKYGRYPTQGCGTTPTDAGSNDAVFATEATCSDYVQGIVPEFMSRLPTDPRRGSNPGFSYLTNTSGTVYKLIVSRTVETDLVLTDDNPLKACAVASGEWCPYGSGSYAYINWCNTGNFDFESSYGTWGGYQFSSSINQYSSNPLGGLNATQLRNGTMPTLNIICRQP